MRICLLTNQNLDETPPTDDWLCDPRPFLPDADWEVLVLAKENAVRRVTNAARMGYDLFFNLCDGAWDEGTPGIEVVQTLERLEVPFTGASSEFYEPTREAMKRVCRASGIPTPDYAFAYDEAALLRAGETLRFPLIVKHPSSYASIGLTAASRVGTSEALFEQGMRMLSEFGGALVEEFVEGTEATVLVAENAGDAGRPLTFQPMRYRFPDGETFKHSDMKWVDYRLMECVPVTDPALDRRLRQVSARFFRGLNGVGYGRCDVRIDREGRPFMLEINPNCGLYYSPEDAGSADHCLLHDPLGHAGFTERIVEAAFARHERERRAWVVVPDDGGYRLVATQGVRAGERVIAFEGRPHELVTLSYVERHWDEEALEAFRRYAWPITDEVWVTWSHDPHQWKPVNHSCDPSAWLDGLDVVARRDLSPGEEITLDYATFYNERMPSFECSCGTARCRGTIHGDDYLRDFVSLYGPHVSDYVRRKREESLRAIET